MIVWLTGQPGSGKTTLAKALQRRLQETQFSEQEDKVVNIDGDGLREVFANLDYSRAGRLRNISSAILVARWLDANGFFVIVSLVSPYRYQREELKESNLVLEVYVHTTLERGRESYFAENYEPPTEDFLDLDTGAKNVDECLYDIINGIINKQYPLSDL